jgi:hypothetical protein
MSAVDFLTVILLVSIMLQVAVLRSAESWMKIRFSDLAIYENGQETAKQVVRIDMCLSPTTPPWSNTSALIIAQV